MAVPKKRQSRATSHMRRSHHARKPMQLALCARCTQPVPPHMACPNCGTYKGRDVIDVTAALDRKERRDKEKMSRK